MLPRCLFSFAPPARCTQTPADRAPAGAQRLTVRLLLAPTLAVAVLSTQAAAQAVTSACQDEMNLGAAFDVGNGVVVQRWNTGAFLPSGASGAHVAHCATNEGIEVTTQVWNELGRLPEIPSDPVGLLLDAAQSPDAVSFADLVERFEAAGLSAQRSYPADARCACGVFYPGTRGAGQ